MPENSFIDCLAGSEVSWVMSEIKDRDFALLSADVEFKSRFYGRIKSVESGCMEWTGALADSGYGIIKLNKRRFKCHRVSFFLSGGPIPDGLCVLHKCDNRKCVNPDHLFLGTVADNNADMLQKGRHVSPKGDKSGVRLYPERRPRGENCKRSKLREGDVLQIRRLLASGETTITIAAEFNVSQSNISAIGRNATWRHLV